eukprot:CAMPEP_0113610522 /NCGR_PEP_ID=MMETSP0017_2-20120614/5073_1 /TAXON_ID=2856 /ORGANISM="Cylindrotheca closterium" /LENGTH=617 /DNA_ID=CAMNT_0000519419 /DNA_START=47 /DNA_END=1897 /DNA_ORIENTATION=+ /assembly_acc=CAM_ASM_000147
MYLQRRIARKLQAVVGGKIEEKVFFGTIDKAIHKTTKSKLQKKRLKENAPPDHWRVTFNAMDDEEEGDDDDQFDEVLNKDEVHNALELYAKHCKQDPQGIDETSLLLAKEHEQQKYMSTGIGGHGHGHRGGGFNIRPPTAIPVSWPYRSKQKKRPLNKVTLAFVLLFVFATSNIASVANQHGKMKLFWIVGDSVIFDQTAAARSLSSSSPLPHNEDHDAQQQRNESFHHFSDNDQQQQQSFSACLLWMDDNHRMPEWLAYHYFALPLRHLIIAVDPHSATQVNISSHWYDLMEITTWHDSDYITSNKKKKKNLTRSPGDTKEQLRWKHRERQSQFYQACCRHLKELNRTYTIFYDTDEYLTISEEYYHRRAKRSKAAATAAATVATAATTATSRHVSSEFRSQPGHILTLLNDYHQQGLDTTWTHRDLAQTCINVPRALYSAVESETEQRDRGVPDWIDANQFDTLRYRHRVTKRGDHDGSGKAIIDVSRLTEEEIDVGGNAHRPMTVACPGKRAWRDYGSLPLGIHHYLGSWESYSFRDDARKGTLRRHDIWLERAKSEAGGSDDEIRDWIGGFTRATSTGNDDDDVLARELLSGAGLSRSDIDEKNASGWWQPGW